MRTRLDAMVGYLAGRDGEGVPAFRAALEDPSSEASRLLEATRLRSRALVEPRPSPAQAPPGFPATRPAPRRGARAAALAASVLLAAAGALGLGEARLRRLEGTLARREAESREDARRLEAALARAVEPPARVAAAPAPALAEVPAPAARTGPVELALARVETGLGKLERRLDGFDRPGPMPAGPETPPIGEDPAIVEIRRDLAALRRELVASDQSGARQVMELRLGLLEVGNLLRLSLNRPPMVIPVPVNAAGNDSLPPQVLSLMGNLASPNQQVRLEAAQQLGRMGHSAQPALPMLQQLLQQETDARVRAAAQAAIGGIR